MSGDMGMEMGMDSETSPECYATDDAFLETLAYCMSIRCNDVPAWNLEKYWNMNVAGRLRQQPDPKATYQQTLASLTKKPTDTLVATEDLNRTMLVSDDDYEGSYNAQDVFEKMEDRHSTYGYVSACCL